MSNESEPESPTEVGLFDGADEEPTEEVRGLRAHAAELERTVRKLRAKATLDRDKVRWLEAAIEHYRKEATIVEAAIAAPPPRPYVIGADEAKANGLPNATYVSLASDWHMEERVRPETVSWRNEYDPDIAAERAGQYWTSNLTMLNVARAAWNIDRYLLWLGGDLITGYIHEEYEEENFKSPTEASLFVYDQLRAGIQLLLDRSDCAEILIVTSHGNHGRTFKKPRIATSARNSHEWLIYQLLDRYFADEPRVKFQIANGYHNLVDLYGRRIRFHHGEEIKYAGGVGGLAVPGQRRIARQARGDEVRVFLDVVGHHHHLQYPPNLIVNGSLIGWTPFAEAKGFEYQEPLQGSFVVDDRYRVVSNFNPIIVT